MKIRGVAAVLALLLLLTARVPAATPVFPVDELRAGMVGIGRTVFQGDELEEFRVHILGVMPAIGSLENWPSE